MQPDGLHSGTRYTYALRQGRLLRVRHGCYVAAEDWLRSPPWIRYDIALAAAASSGSAPLFCRESALRLHGIPLLTTPQTVAARTWQHGRAGVRHTGPMTGSVPIHKFIQNYGRRFEQTQTVNLQSFENFPTQRIEPALPESLSRVQLREQILNGEHVPLRVQLDADVLAPVMSSAAFYLAEPLELALVDTASRLPFLDAVVILDAARNHELVDLQQWLPYLRSHRLRRNWELAWDFADARSESPLESASRALIHQLGFKTPTPQVTISTDEGRFRMDVAWMGEGIVGEVDGRIKYYDDAALNGHDPRDVAYAEKRRRDALDRRGLTVVRWGYKELRAPELLARRLQEAGVPCRV